MDYTDHHFRVDLAQQYGVESAIFLHDVYYWVRHNRNNQKNFHDGRYWTYNTMKSFCEMHPYWSRRQIERIIAKCKDAGLLLVGCFNQSTWDRTSWYSLSDEAMRFFCDDMGPGSDDPDESPPADGDDIPEPDTPEMAECISPNGEMHGTERGNPFHQTVKPIPDNIPYSKPDNKSPPKAPQGGQRAGKKKDKSMPKYQPEWFERFWKKYPPREGRKDHRPEAVAAWDKLKPSLELCLKMSEELEPKNWPESWHRDKGRYIPLASTWLNGERWNVERVAAGETKEKPPEVRYGVR